MAEEIQKKLIEQEMKESYLDYAMSVITSRALPDVRDGLKPVHRRILYAMHKMGMVHNKPFKKSARVVGECLGKYHPHGDSAVYDSLVRMAQSFSLRYPLINGQGNFGSVDGDRAAAMRYTECKLRKLSDEMLKDIDKDTVNFVDNFDSSLKEPSVLPSMVPNLLVNGSSGIAVGMATNIPPHNLGEVVDAIVAYIKNNEIGIGELMDFLKAPDFPTGGLICGTSGVKQAYRTGKGKVVIKARTEIEEGRIIINEIPYMVNKSTLIESIAGLVKSGSVKDISDIRDESDREGMRVVIELKKNADADIVLNQLFKHTSLRNTFGINMLALDDGNPVVLNIKEMIVRYVEHRKEVIVRRTKFDLNKAEEKAHLLSGLKVALDNVDEIVALIKGADNVEVARHGLMQGYGLSEKQAQAILEMRLQRLTSLETEKIKRDYEETLKMIVEFKSILDSAERVLGMIVEKLEELKKNYGDDRRTEIAEEIEDVDVEDLIKEERVVVNVSHSGYIKQMPLKTYKSQRRGGKGVQGTKLKEEDVVDNIFVTSNLNYLLFFSDKGKVYWLKAYKLPTGSRYARGSAIVNLLRLGKDEKINEVLAVSEFETGKSVMFCTKEGLVKKTSLGEFARPRKGGIRAIGLRENDEVVSVRLTSGVDEFIIATRKGNAVKFNEEDVRNMGRTAGGVRGVTLGGNDCVVGMERCVENGSIFTITENGFGKRTKLGDYRLIRRGGKGVRNIITSDRNGNVVAIGIVVKGDGLILMSEKGVVIRVNAEDVSCIGRNTQGLKVMGLGVGDRVVSVAKIKNEDEESKEIENVVESAKDIGVEGESMEGESDEEVEVKGDEESDEEVEVKGDEESDEEVEVKGDEENI